MCYFSFIFDLFQNLFDFMKILDLLISQTIPIIIAGVIMTRCFLDMLLISQKDNHTGQFSPF